MSTLLVGDATIEATADSDSGHIIDAFEYTAGVSGTADTLSLYVAASSTATALALAIYSDSGSGRPGTLLGQTAIFAPTANTWNAQALTANVSITSGTTYWLALCLSGTGTLNLRTNTAANADVYNVAGSPTTFPGTWPSTGNTTAAGQASFQALQTGTAFPLAGTGATGSTGVATFMVITPSMQAVSQTGSTGSGTLTTSTGATGTGQAGTTATATLTVSVPLTGKGATGTTGSLRVFSPPPTVTYPTSATLTGYSSSAAVRGYSSSVVVVHYTTSASISE